MITRHVLLIWLFEQNPIACGSSKVYEPLRDRAGFESGHRCRAAIGAEHRFVQVNLGFVSAHTVVGANQPLLQVSDGPIGQCHYRLGAFAGGCERGTYRKPSQKQIGGRRIASAAIGFDYNRICSLLTLFLTEPALCRLTLNSRFFPKPLLQHALRSGRRLRPCLARRARSLAAAAPFTAHLLPVLAELLHLLPLIRR
jgi:hypothetical protein